MTEVDKAKLVKLVSAGRELNDRFTAVLDEIDAILGGKAAIGDILKDLRKHWQSVWGARYGGQPYAWAMVKDVPQMKRLVKMLGPDELKARFTSYVQDSEPFLTRARHPFGLFVSKVNQYAGEKPTGDLVLGGDDSAPVGCKHQPPCLTDVAHTAKVRAEMRM